MTIERLSRNRSTDTPNNGEPLLRLDDGEIIGELPEDVREQFRDGALLSAVRDGGTIRLQEVKR